MPDIFDELVAVDERGRKSKEVDESTSRPQTGAERVGETIGRGLYEVGAQPFRMGREAIGGFTGAMAKGLRGITDVVPAQLGTLAGGGTLPEAVEAGRQAEAESRTGRRSALSPVYRALEKPMEGATPSWAGRTIGKLGEGAVGLATGIGVPREAAQQAVETAGDIGALAGGKYLGGKAAGAVREAGGIAPALKSIPESMRGVPSALKERFSRQPSADLAKDWMRMRSLSGDVFGSSALDAKFKAEPGIAGFTEAATDTTANAAKIIYDDINRGTEYTTALGKMSSEPPKTFLDNALATQTVLNQKSNLSRGIMKEAVDKVGKTGLMPEFDISSGSPARQRLEQMAHDTFDPDIATAMRKILDARERYAAEGGEISSITTEPITLSNVEKVLTRLRETKKPSLTEGANPTQRAAQMLYDNIRSWANDQVASILPERAGEWAKLRQEEAILHNVSDHVRNVGEEALRDAGAKRGALEAFGRLMSSWGGREAIVGTATGHPSLVTRGLVNVAGDLSKGAFKKLDRTVSDMYSQVKRMTDKGELFPYETPRQPRSTTSVPPNAPIPVPPGAVRPAVAGGAMMNAAEQERRKRQWGQPRPIEQEE